MRVKFLKAYKGHLKGTSYDASPNEAFGLIDSGVAIATKDMVEDDYKITSGDITNKQEKANGKPTQLRSYYSK